MGPELYTVLLDSLTSETQLLGHCDVPNQT